MADPHADGERRMRRRHESHGGLEDEKLHKSRGKGRVTQDPERADVRRVRVERLERSSSTDGTPIPSTMTSESHTTRPSLKSSSTQRRRGDHHRGPEETKHRRRRESLTNDDSAPTYVYGAPADRPKGSRLTLSETRRLGRDGESTESDEENATQPEPVNDKKPRAKKIRIVYVTKEESKTLKQKERRVKADNEAKDRHHDGDNSIHRSGVPQSRRKSVAEAPSPLPKRSASTKHLPTETKPGLQRSNTTSSHIPSTRSSHPPSISGTNSTNKRSSFLGSFFGPAAPQLHEPEKLVECLTCLDDVPRSKSAKLKCGHHMCHACLKRIFRLSATDPQHMPPKCCTTDHIPLKHVEKLFDINFKKTWNRKFQEYSTKNRIYCPARRCGEWIKPGNIHKEGGVKYGKCGRCKTKVCCLCNGKWHGSKDCPKDEETNQLLQAAKDAGWQRCYSCRTMVELKEGCNHMTCRCTAEFCMICGLKWKSCNCPWFNYEAVEADRLEHMQPLDAEDEPERERPRRLRRQRPNPYHDENGDRRRQERRDEELARRMQRAALTAEDDYQGGIGDIHEIGNAAGHFMNEDYIRAAQNILTGNYDQATAAANYVMGVANARGVRRPPPPRLEPRRMVERYPGPLRTARPPSPPPPLRRHSMREHAYNSAQARPAEIVVPRRTRTDYEAEAAIHAPPGRRAERMVTGREPRPAVLAGLGGRGGNRVNAWRTHVELGVTPEEGVISVL